MNYDIPMQESYSRGYGLGYNEGLKDAPQKLKEQREAVLDAVEEHIANVNNYLTPVIMYLEAHVYDAAGSGEAEAFQSAQDVVRELKALQQWMKQFRKSEEA